MRKRKNEGVMLSVVKKAEVISIIRNGKFVEIPPFTSNVPSELEQYREEGKTKKSLRFHTGNT